MQRNPETCHGGGGAAGVRLNKARWATHSRREADRLVAQGRVAVALTGGGRAALERRLVTSAPPPPPPDSSPSIPTARWTGSSPDVNWFRARADFADY